MEYFWIIPVISIAVWILSSLIRQENPPRRDPMRPRRWPDSGRGTDPSSRPLGEVDRFLDEINNLRKKGEEDRPVEARELPRSAPKPVPIPRAEPLSRPRPAARSRPPEGATSRRPPIEVVVSTPAPWLFPAPPTKVEPAVKILDVLPAPVPAPAPPSLSVPTPRSSPAVAQLYAMLRSPQSLRTAMLLQALLGPPRCRKRRF